VERRQGPARLGVDVEDLDLDNRRARVRIQGGRARCAGVWERSGMHRAMHGGAPVAPGRFRPVSSPVMPRAGTKRPSSSRRGELQQALGDLGVIAPRVDHGTAVRRAQGWYAELYDGRDVFLGDYTALALLTITELQAKAQA
jgi:hypothetical protein